jgi:hypothetical protein
MLAQQIHWSECGRSTSLADSSAAGRPHRSVFPFAEISIAMSKRDFDWYVPEDWLWHFGNLVVVGCLVVLSSVLLPLVARLKATEVTTLYGLGVGAGILGILVLFVARLPLYRRHKFWTVGPRELDRTHRRLYWLAYAFVAAGLFLLWIVWLRTK